MTKIGKEGHCCSYLLGMVGKQNQRKCEGKQCGDLSSERNMASHKS